MTLSSIQCLILLLISLVCVDSVIIITTLWFTRNVGINFNGLMIKSRCTIHTLSPIIDMETLINNSCLQDCLPFEGINLPKNTNFSPKANVYLQTSLNPTISTSMIKTPKKNYTNLLLHFIIPILCCFVKKNK